MGSEMCIRDRERVVESGRVPGSSCEVGKFPARVELGLFLFVFLVVPELGAACLEVLAVVKVGVVVAFGGEAGLWFTVLVVLVVCRFL